MRYVAPDVARRALFRGLIFRLSSGTMVSPFPLGRFLQVLAGVLPAIKEGLDGPDQGLPARAEFADAVSGDLFE